MKFDSDLLISYFIGMTLLAPIFKLDLETFFTNAFIVLFGILFTLFLSNIFLGKRRKKNGKKITKNN
jgi:hypothetical protein